MSSVDVLVQHKAFRVFSLPLSVVDLVDLYLIACDEQVRRIFYGGACT